MTANFAEDREAVYAAVYREHYEQVHPSFRQKVRLDDGDTHADVLARVKSVRRRPRRR